MTFLKKTRLDDKTIIAKYNKCKDAYNKWDLFFKAALYLGASIADDLIRNYLIDYRISARRVLASDLVEILNPLMLIINLTFAIIHILTFIAFIFSAVKTYRYFSWANKFEELEKERRQ